MYEEHLNAKRCAIHVSVHDIWKELVSLAFSLEILYNFLPDCRDHFAVRLPLYIPRDW